MTTPSRASATKSAPASRTLVGRRRGSAERARRRRAATSIPAAGRPVRSALSRVPFVVALIAVLSAGAVGVLFINTKTDESGIRTQQVQAASSELRLQIEALGRTVAQLNATPRIAQQAQALGLTPAGDAAILVINQDGTTKLIGKPHPVNKPADTAASDKAAR